MADASPFAPGHSLWVWATVTAGVFSLAALFAVPSSASTAGGRPGIGSTLAQWKHAYAMDRGHGHECNAANICFGAGLRNSEDGETFQFTQLDVVAGVVAGYDQNLPNGTTLAEAEAQISFRLPTDATLGPVVIDHTGGSCAMVNVSSPTLAKELNTPKVGDTTGVVGIEFNRLDANADSVYSATNIQNAAVGISPEDPTAAC